MNITKKIHYGVDIILMLIIVVLLLGSCSPTQQNEVKIETYSERKSNDPNDWKKEVEETNQIVDAFADFTNKVLPEDLCRPKYQNEIDQMGIRFINAGNKGKQLIYTGDGNLFPNYKQYTTYFDQNIEIGKQVRSLSSAIKDGKYRDAVQNLSSIIEQIDKLEVV